MNVDVFNQQNQKTEEMDLPDGIFAVKWNPDLVYQALMVQLANRRRPLAHAKGRSEVSGGGRKPWRQKGTGRARHGSTRSPIWIGGGVTHGPIKNKNFSRKINKKMKQLAIFSVLSKKTKDLDLKVVDKFDLEAKKTKDWRNVLKNLADLRSKTLIIPSVSMKDAHRGIGNIEKAEAVSPYSLNVYDLLNCKNIILEKRAVEEIKNHYCK